MNKSQRQGPLRQKKGPNSTAHTDGNFDQEGTALLKADTVDLVRDLVPAVRRLLARGLCDSSQRSCVRIGGFGCFGGGLKSSLVGGLRIDVNAVLKLGRPDLALHQRLSFAIASAHICLAALLKGDAHRAARRFVLAHTLWHLAEWNCRAAQIRNLK